MTPENHIRSRNSQMWVFPPKCDVGTTQNGVSTTQNGVSTTQNDVGTTQNGVGTTQNGVSTTQNGVGTTQNGVGTTRNGVGTTEDGVGKTECGIGTTESEVNWIAAAPPLYSRKSSAFPMTYLISLGGFAAGGRAATNRLRGPAKRSFAANRRAEPNVNQRLSTAAHRPPPTAHRPPLTAHRPLLLRRRRRLSSCLGTPILN